MTWRREPWNADNQPGWVEAKLKSQCRLTMNATDWSRIESRRKELQSELEAAYTEITSLQRQGGGVSVWCRQRIWSGQVQGLDLTAPNCQRVQDDPPVTVPFPPVPTYLISENATHKSEDHPVWRQMTLPLQNLIVFFVQIVVLYKLNRLNCQINLYKIIKP